MSNVKTQLLLSVTEVARQLSFRPRTIAKWCRDGTFPTAHKVGRVWRIAVDDPRLHLLIHEEASGSQPE